MHLVAAGLDAMGAAADAGEQGEHARIHRHAGSLDQARGLAHADAARDREVDRLGPQRERAMRVPPPRAGDERRGKDQEQHETEDKTLHRRSQSTEKPCPRHGRPGCGGRL